MACRERKGDGRRLFEPRTSVKDIPVPGRPENPPANARVAPAPTIRTCQSHRQNRDAFPSLVARWRDQKWVRQRWCFNGGARAEGKSRRGPRTGAPSIYLLPPPVLFTRFFFFPKPDFAARDCTPRRQLPAGCHPAYWRRAPFSLFPFSASVKSLRHPRCRRPSVGHGFPLPRTTKVAILPPPLPSQIFASSALRAPFLVSLPPPISHTYPL